MRAGRRIVQAIAVVLVSGIGFAAGRYAFATSPTQHFYQEEFGAAVMVAIGRGFVAPEPAPGGALASFLAMKRDRLAVSEVDAIGATEANAFQARQRYLLTAVGWWWRIAGISWARLAEIAGLGHALAVASVFALLRLFVPLAPSLAGAVLFAISPLQLGYAAHLRDFMKGAFVLAALPLVIALALRPIEPRALLFWSAATGGVIGIGSGFKFDVFIMAPIALVSLLAFRDPRLSSAWRNKVFAAVLLLAAFAITAWPVLARQSSSGSNAPHVSLLGYSDWFDPRLGIEPAPYSFLPSYSDEYLMDALRVRSVQGTGVEARLPSPEYDRAGVELWQSWIWNFPADQYTRLLAAMNGVMNLAFDNPAPLSVRWPPLSWLSGVSDWLMRWRGWGWALGLAILMAAARVSIGRALFAAFLMVALAGYPAVQFDPRHYFHLQAVPLAALVVMIWTALALRADHASVRRSWRVSAVTAALIAVLVLLPVPVLRAYQDGHLHDVVSSTIALPRTPVGVTFAGDAPGRTLAKWDAVEGVDAGAVGLKAAYYLAEFNADDANTAMAIGLRYREAPSWTPCAIVQSLATDRGLVRFLFPAYSADGRSAFDGIEMGPEMRRRLAGVYRLNAWPETAPLMMRLAADWDERRLHQRLIAEERVGADDVRVDAVSARGPCGAEIDAIDATLSTALAVRPDDIARSSATVAVAASGIAVDGRADRDAPALVEFTPIELSEGDTLVARVFIERGGVAIGLRRDGAWVKRVVTPRPGLSVVSVRADAGGIYVPTIESADPGWRPALAFSVDRFGIVRGAGTAR